MKKRIKIKKIILSCFTAFCLGLGLITPFINNDIVVSALNDNSTDYGVFTLNEPLTFNDLDVNGGTWYSKHFVGTDITSLTGSNIEIKLHFPTAGFDGLSVGNTAIITYLDTNNTFGNSYGFFVGGISNYFNAFKIQVGTNNINTYRVSLCNVADKDRPDQTSNDLTLATCDNGSIIYSYSSIFYTNSNSLNVYMSGVTSQGSFAPLWFESLTTFDNTYDFDFNTLYSGKSYCYGTAFDLQPYVDYFNITADFSSSYAGFEILFDFDTLSLYIGRSDNIYFNNTCMNGANVTISLMKGNLPLNEIAFLFNILGFNFYPSSVSYNITLNDYFAINTNALYDNKGFTITFNASNRVKTIDGLFVKFISFNPIENEGSILRYSVSDNANLTNIYVLTIYNKTQDIFLNNYDFTYLTFHCEGSKSLTDTQYALSNLKNFYAVDGFATPVKGWYTFDIAPFDSVTEKVDIDLDISFTADSKGYNNLRIIADNVMGTYVGSIYYRNLDDNGDVINEYVPYQYQRLPYQSEWLTFNARQLFFDETLIDYSTYDTLNDLGVFTFISNNPNNNQTMVDLFWGVAEVPIVTIRKVFDFEILGTNVTNFIMSMITISIILFLIRRLF